MEGGWVKGTKAGWGGRGGRRGSFAPVPPVLVCAKESSGSHWVP